MKRFHTITISLLVLIMIISSSGWAQDTYIQPDALDIETIKEEEMMDPSSEVTRIYIFLAVWNGNAYDTYATSGNSDGDGDGAKAIEEPNDLNEYEQLTHQIENQLVIEDSVHISYINSMPNFSELFPNQDNPFDFTDLIEVETEETFEDENRLLGTKTISVYEGSSGAIGVERYIAFYNREDGGNKVKSYGFASVQIVE